MDNDRYEFEYRRRSAEGGRETVTFNDRELTSTGFNALSAWQNIRAADPRYIDKIKDMRTVELRTYEYSPASNYAVPEQVWLDKAPSSQEVSKMLEAMLTGWKSAQEQRRVRDAARTNFPVRWDFDPVEEFLPPQVLNPHGRPSGLQISEINLADLSEREAHVFRAYWELALPRHQGLSVGLVFGHLPTGGVYRPETTSDSNSRREKAIPRAYYSEPPKQELVHDVAVAYADSALMLEHHGLGESYRQPSRHAIEPSLVVRTWAVSYVSGAAVFYGALPKAALTPSEREELSELTMAIASRDRSYATYGTGAGDVFLGREHTPSGPRNLAEDLAPWREDALYQYTLASQVDIVMRDVRRQATELGILHEPSLARSQRREQGAGLGL